MKANHCITDFSYSLDTWGSYHVSLQYVWSQKLLKLPIRRYFFAVGELNFWDGPYRVCVYSMLSIVNATWVHFIFLPQMTDSSIKILSLALKYNVCDWTSTEVLSNCNCIDNVDQFENCLRIQLCCWFGRLVEGERCVKLTDFTCQINRNNAVDIFPVNKYFCNLNILCHYYRSNPIWLDRVRHDPYQPFVGDTDTERYTAFIYCRTLFL